MEEIWKDIEGWYGYQVSNYGNVRTLNRIINNHFVKGKVLKPQISNGYYRVHLHSHCSTKSFLVHRLVAQAFIENPFKLEHVNHIDENHFNNRADNLEWCTQAYNNTYGTKLQRMSETMRKKYAKSA